MQHVGHTYARKCFIVHLKFRCNRAFCFLFAKSGNPKAKVYLFFSLILKSKA